MIFVNKRFLSYFDWINFGLLLLLSCISLAFVFSTTYKIATFSPYFKKQLFGVIAGIGIYFFCSFIDYRTLCRAGYWLYIFTLFLLALTLIKGSVGMGAQRWINLGIIKFQPSELAKLFLPMFMTYYFFNDKEEYKPQTTTFIIPFLVLFISFILVLKQPDLGTSIILFASGSFMLWFTGVPTKFFLAALSCLIISTPLTWHFLKPYQKKRILVFLGQGNRNVERYQIEQSKIAVGSGGLFGKGFAQGTQNNLSFLPESRTDFIFSVICEETGLIGALIILFLYLALFLRLLWLINTITGFYPYVMCLGLLLPLILSMIINICMVLDLLPIVGNPLPFISYGITHIWTGFASLGCINSITCQRYFQEL